MYLKIFPSELPEKVHDWYFEPGTDRSLNEMHCLFQKNWHLNDKTLEPVIKGWIHSLYYLALISSIEP